MEYPCLQLRSILLRELFKHTSEVKVLTRCHPLDLFVPVVSCSYSRELRSLRLLVSPTKDHYFESHENVDIYVTFFFKNEFF